jgi:hypothetical protein
MRKAKFNVGDTVRLLDGKDIPNYSGFWMPGMKEYVGMETTVEHVQYDKYTNQFRYMVADADYVWDERGLEAVESKPDWKVLIVPLDGKTTEGRLFENEKVVKTATTKKSKEDEYSVEEACKIIVERLFEKEVLKKETEREPFPVGTIVRITDSCANDYGLPKNLLGRIVGHRSGISSAYIVDFGLPYSDKLHDCYQLPSNTGLWLYEHRFEKVDV